MTTTNATQSRSLTCVIPQAFFVPCSSASKYQLYLAELKLNKDTDLTARIELTDESGAVVSSNQMSVSSMLNFGFIKATPLDLMQLVYKGCRRFQIVPQSDVSFELSSSKSTRSFNPSELKIAKIHFQNAVIN